MAHYPQIFSINALMLQALLGYYDAERGRPQTIRVDVRLFFPQTPACANDDHARFLDYALITTAISELVAQKTFRLIEFMGSEIFHRCRALLDAHGEGETRLWVRLTKCTTPIANLEGGASFITSDLPAGATYPRAE